MARCVHYDGGGNGGGTLGVVADLVHFRCHVRVNEVQCFTSKFLCFCHNKQSVLIIVSSSVQASESGSDLFTTVSNCASREYTSVCEREKGRD